MNTPDLDDVLRFIDAGEEVSMDSPVADWLREVVKRELNDEIRRAEIRALKMMADQARAELAMLRFRPWAKR